MEYNILPLTIGNPSEAGRSLGTGVRSVHENGCFREWAPMVAVIIQKKGYFSGREDTNKKETPPKGCPTKCRCYQKAIVYALKWR